MNENQCSNHEIHMLFEHRFKCTMLKMSPDLFDITRESIPAWTDHYINVNVCKNITGVMTFDAILFGEIQCKKNGILRFSVFISGFLVRIR